MNIRTTLTKDTPIGAKFKVIRWGDGTIPTYCKDEIQTLSAHTPNGYKTSFSYGAEIEIVDLPKTPIKGIVGEKVWSEDEGLGMIVRTGDAKFPNCPIIVDFQNDSAKELAYDKTGQWYCGDPKDGDHIYHYSDPEVPEPQQADGWKPYPENKPQVDGEKQWLVQHPDGSNSVFIHYSKNCWHNIIAYREPPPKYTPTKPKCEKCGREL